MGVRNIITIVMDQGKKIKIHNTGTIHQFEINADEMLILLPCNCGGISISKCEVEIHYSNSQIKDGKISLEDTPIQYNDQYLQYKSSVPPEMTFVGGRLPIWIECINKAENVRILSDKSYVEIIEIIKLDDNSIAKIAPALGQWVVKMTQIENHANEILKQAMDQANRAANAASLALDVLKGIKEGGV